MSFALPTPVALRRLATAFRSVLDRAESPSTTTELTQLKQQLAITGTHVYDVLNQGLIPTNWTKKYEIPTVTHTSRIVNNKGELDGIESQFSYPDIWWLGFLRALDPQPSDGSVIAIDQSLRSLLVSASGVLKANVFPEEFKWPDDSDLDKWRAICEASVHALEYLALIADQQKTESTSSVISTTDHFDSIPEYQAGPDWLSVTQVADAIGTSADSLRQQRRRRGSIRHDSRMYGIDSKGRQWRRIPGSTPTSNVFYYRPSITNTSNE